MLPRAQTKKEFRECLEGWISPPRHKSGEYPRGRRRELRSYVLEANGGCKKEGSAGGMRWSVADTGVDKLKILSVECGRGVHEAFMDTSDSRFYILHTNERSETATGIVDMLTGGWSHPFDRMWMHHGMLEAIAKKAGNSLRGFGAKYSGELSRKVGEEEGGDGGGQEIEGLSLTINGSMACSVDRAVRNAECLGNAIAYNRLRIMRGQAGNPGEHAIDDVTSTGCFAMKHGRSVLDHLDLVRVSKDVYSGAVGGIEECRLGTRQVGGKHIARGGALNFAFKEPIPDLRRFMRRVFSVARPFRLWGLESKLEDGYFSVAGVDLHTGSPMNFEITRDFMRVYLSAESRGSAVLRLLTNLQLHYGRGIACERVDQLVRGK